MPQSQEAIVQTNPTVCDLVKNPELYNGKEVTTEAEYMLGFEWSVLLSEECPSQIWLEPHGLDEVSTRTLKQAYDAGPVYLKVQGTFAAGSHYGHMSGFSYQFTAHKVLTLLKVSLGTYMLTDPGGLDWTTYGTSLFTSVYKSWIASMPDSVEKGQQGKNSVTFRVLRDGTVPDDSMKLASSSNASELDEASLKAIRAAAPFERLPEKCSQPLIHLCTVFYYNARPKPVKEENPYFKALFASIVAMDKAYAKIDDSVGGSSVRTDYHHMLVERDAPITDFLPEQFGEYRVEYLDPRHLTARFKKLRREFSVLKIEPIKAAEPNLTVLVSLYWVSYKKRKLNLGLSDWSEVRFLYDCEKQTYVVSNVKLGGV